MDAWGSRPSSAPSAFAMRNPARNHNLARNAEQVGYQNPRAFLSAEEAAAAEESLSVYCKPVELYNILQRRALRHPLFLQRCLRYKIQAKKQRRIKLTITFLRFFNTEEQRLNILPFYVLVSSKIDSSEDSAIYRSSRTCLLKVRSQPGCNEQSAVSFILPEIAKLSEDVVTDNLTIVFVSCVDSRNDCNGKDSKLCPLVNYTGQVLWGKLDMGSLCSSWERSLCLKLGHRANMLSAVDLQGSSLEHAFLDNGSHHLIFKAPNNLNKLTSPMQLQVDISAQELGPREKSSYNSYSFSDIPSSLLSRIIRLRAGNVIFNYKYYNNTLQKTEVTEDFSCPFCLVRCASFTGLRRHLTSCHEFFTFEFLVTEEYQAVNVSVKNEIWRSEGNILDSDGNEARFKTFCFCSNPLKRRRSAEPNRTYIHCQIEKLNSPETTSLGRSQNTLTKCVAINSLETSVGPFSNGILASKEPSSPRIIHIQSSGGLNLEIENSTEQEQASLIAQALPAWKDAPQLAHAGIIPLEEEREKLKNLSSRDIALPSERQEMVTSFVEHARVGDALASGAQSSVATGVCLAAAVTPGTSECGPQTDASNLSPPPRLQFGKTRKLSVERAEPRSRILLQKRQFFHSHRAQPMAMEQVLSDRDSEDEVDDDIADFEDRRMLDDFVDVTKHEKKLMHLWNSFVRKQHVLADGHISWACEAFSKYHGQDLARIQALQWCWRLFMIKLWNHNLLDGGTMNRCNSILENYSKNQ